MGVEINMQWIGRSAADYSRLLRNANVKYKNLKEPLKEIAYDVIAPSIEKNFASGGRPPWRPLSDNTLDRKSSMGVSEPSKILFHTGALEAAASNPAGYTIDRKKLVAYPKGISYWGFHQVGDGVPQRVIMMLQAADRDQITKILANFVRSGIDMKARSVAKFGI